MITTTIYIKEKVEIHLTISMALNHQNPSVVIIGSGAAGYSAACKLLEHGYSNITVLEAENRIGGRINSVPFGSATVDLGAQWCHGETNNIVYETVKDLNLLENSQDDNSNLSFIDSQSNFRDANKLVALLFALEGDVEQLQAFNGSLGEYITHNYERKLNTEYPNVDRTVATQVLNWFHKLQNNLNASTNWFELSASTEYVNCEGDLELNWKGKGYKTIFSVLKKEIPDPSKKLPVAEKIFLNKEVTKIIWNKINTDKVIIRCSDGSEYKADHVIITVSLGVLKHLHDTLFEPEIPAFKKIAIQGLSFGCVNKILLNFPKPWWPSPARNMNLLWLEEDRNNIISEFPEGPNKDGQSWLTAFFSFLPIDSNPNVLLAFINGEFSEQIESLSDDLIKRGIMYLLKKFYGKHYNIPDPDSIIRSSWGSNEHFRGSYSFNSLETKRLNTNAAELAKPLGDNSVLFAGEATHSTFYSTVHGAIETGIREAQRIISHHRSQESSKAD